MEKCFEIPPVIITYAYSEKALMGYCVEMKKRDKKSEQNFFVFLWSSAVNELWNG
jgi:hypothetical protein